MSPDEPEEDAVLNYIKVEGGPSEDRPQLDERVRLPLRQTDRQTDGQAALGR